ncbi:unnamed protein product [marine sediment metagenome]|uniref:Uncharacterized protein n=1 Tax=marine sediment metagenome TaxID=412755 RepID=X1R348_9ZZZZ
MALTEGECNQCRLELDKLKAQYEGAGEVPDVARARLSELESALDSECSSSDAHSSGLAGAAVVGLVGFGLVAALLTAISGSRQ